MSDDARPATAVPDPRFRDQLARWVPHTMGCFAHRTDDVGMDYRCICFHDGLVDRLAPKLEAHIAAEVEARVQAAANQRAAEAWIEAATACERIGVPAQAAVFRARADALAAAAQPTDGRTGE